MRYLLGLIIGAAALWLLLSGHYTPMVLGLGAFSCLFCAYVCHRMGIVASGLRSVARGGEMDAREPGTIPYHPLPPALGVARYPPYPLL